ncbi:aldehyde dehydrogenase family protein [Variovorax sp. KK3]|uniref:aldehyde dehydrogenase family protein n=1 Tax=Variovorax sp. KK3 TaxID=1855728 RepID=UPI00097C2A13|nr:aldehyde dehydrogenase family protein [Variovorax sp. KK3]
MNGGQFYIGGHWVDPVEPRACEVIDPASEQSAGRIALGCAADVDRAVDSARAAFGRYAASTREFRLALLGRVRAAYERHAEALAQAVSTEMGAPITLARRAHVPAGLGHIDQAIKVLREYEFDERMEDVRVTREPIGVCAFITPWNWPINQIACKVAPALAAGCTMVLKPSEVAPLSALLFAQILHEAEVPAGVFNLVNGDGPGVGAALAAHPEVDMVSFTGSTRGGTQVAIAAAPTVKRVTQELGGKSANIILRGADLEAAVTHGIRLCFNNSGQSCNAPTRMFVPAELEDEAVRIAQQVAAGLVLGAPADAATTHGPVANRVQFDRIQSMLQAGIDEGARLAFGGPGRPEGLASGFYVRPTLFRGVRNDMRIAREEIFGPVLVMIPYDTEDEAVAQANDSEYGLSSYVHGPTIDAARAVARRMRAGMVHINGAMAQRHAPFGGYKRSGNGREWGRYGFEEFLEIKSMFGYHA